VAKATLVAMRPILSVALQMAIGVAPPAGYDDLLLIREEFQGCTGNVSRQQSGEGDEPGARWSPVDASVSY
jgi:hypothetical protein